MSPTFDRDPHTPGPWEWDAESETISGFDTFGERQIVVYELGTNESNNLLLTAAPELLAACKAAIHALKGREHDGFLRDAIAKAEGTTR